MTEKDKPETNKPIESHLENTDSGSYIQRRTQLRSSLDALAYVFHLIKQPGVKTRDSDRLTELAMLLASIATTLCLLLHKLNGLSLQITLLCDFMLGSALTVYVFNRLGILTSMTPRQAMLVWQLIRAFCYVGLFIAINLVLILSWSLSVAPLSTIRVPSFQ